MLFHCSYLSPDFGVAEVSAADQAHAGLLFGGIALNDELIGHLAAVGTDVIDAVCDMSVARKVGAAAVATSSQAASELAKADSTATLSKVKVRNSPSGVLTSRPSR